MAPVVSILDNARDVFQGIEWDQRTEWPDDGAPYDAPVANSAARPEAAPSQPLPGSTPPPAPPPAPAKRSLGDRVSRVEFIADAIERLCDEDALDSAAADALSAELIAELAGTRAKTDATCSVFAMLESLKMASEREIERLTKRAAKYGAQLERLEKYVTAVMTTSKLERLDGDTSTLTLRRNPPAVQIAADAQIPFEFLFFPEPPPGRPDKGALKKALKAGRKIAGVTLESGQRLVRS